MPMSATHPTAAAGFARAADAYERGRPGYPREAIDHLAAELGLWDGTTVLDLAAGTGKLTRMLRATGATVIAVEPVEAMRRVLREAVPGVEVRDGTAESIPAADGALDAVTIAQAFHWFDAGPALAEIHRVLGPGGGLGLIWNMFDTTVDWVAALQALVLGFHRGEPQYGGSGWRDELAACGLFEPLSEHVSGHVQELSTADLLARIGSTSYIATLPGSERDLLFSEIRALVADLPRPLHLPYRTDTFVTRRA
jgi:ubiquinone/menaquinone biosynthesis C-methylase UbiE